MNQYKILLVEDDAEISEMLRNYLTAENYDVICAFDGQEACAKFDSASVHLVLLDLMIPKISGMDVMQHIRGSSVVPIIILSAKDSESDKTLGLGLGADDYITKPFSVAEVLARIRA
ncbi:MAG: response regulator transcription factor, partial [Lachnospiraceae bacterium]|nr:response regulator transcription factor [Lachnospiraceae bacterium]